MAEIPSDKIIIPPEPGIQIRYTEILGRLTQGDSVILEEIGFDTLRQLCIFSNKALISAYVMRPDDPELDEMESLHLALDDVYSDHADDLRRARLPHNVRIFPGVDPEHEATVKEPIEPSPAWPIEKLRYIAQIATRD